MSGRVETCIILLLLPVLHHAQHITLHPGRVSLPQCSGVTPIICHSLGKRCTCKAEFQGGWWNLGLCLCCKLGQLRLMACFTKPCAARKDLVFLFIIFSVCYFAITFACCIIFQCPKTWFLSQMWTLCFLWVPDFSLFNCGWDWALACHFPDLPFCRSHNNSVKTNGVLQGCSAAINKI